MQIKRLGGERALPFPQRWTFAPDTTLMFNLETEPLSKRIKRRLTSVLLEEEFSNLFVRLVRKTLIKTPH